MYLKPACGRLLAASAIIIVMGSARAAELTVSAASSLGNAFRDIAQAYEKQYPDTRVLLNLGASGTLLSQMLRGAPVDVFASADQPTMDRALKQGLVQPDTRRDFARNTLVLIVPTDSSLALNGLDDLARPGVQKVAIGNPASVPVGNYAMQALEAAGQWKAVSARAINTQNVRQSLDYVARAEVDAGFVYGTDARLMPDRVRVAFEVPSRAPILYPVAVATRTDNASDASRFIRYLQSDAGQAILARYGFLKP